MCLSSSAEKTFSDRLLLPFLHCRPFRCSRVLVWPETLDNGNPHTFGRGGWNLAYWKEKPGLGFTKTLKRNSFEYFFFKRETEINTVMYLPEH